LDNRRLRRECFFKRSLELSLFWKAFDFLGGFGSCSFVFFRCPAYFFDSAQFQTGSHALVSLCHLGTLRHVPHFYGLDFELTIKV